MKNSNKLMSLLSAVFISFSLLSLAWVSVLAIISPQYVMDLVSVKLENTDAISSIRGIYGGVGITICALLAYL
jgi:nitrate reductase gamma subunit